MQDQSRDEDEPQGCVATLSSLGLAAYTLLILGIGASSCVCGLFSLNTALLNLTTSSALKGPVELEPWRLEELKRSGVVREGEVLALYHDHSPMGDGSSGCVVAGENVVRWDEGTETGRVAIVGATVEDRGSEVSVSLDGNELLCPFGEDEGGDRFAHMLEASSEQ